MKDKFLERSNKLLEKFFESTSEEQRIEFFGPDMGDRDSSPSVQEYFNSFDDEFDFLKELNELAILASDNCITSEGVVATSSPITDKISVIIKENATNIWEYKPPGGSFWQKMIKKDPPQGDLFLCKMIPIIAV